MSILVELAQKADVSVEGVVRVLTREPVSDAIKDRVLGALDELTPEQTRAVQRFALAALHDVVEHPGAAAAAGQPAPDPDQLVLPVATAGPELVPTLARDAALVELSSVLGELAEAVRDLRRETDAERRERVDDLAVLIDLITTGWQGLDSRLGRIERQVSRLESGRRENHAPPAAPPAVAPSEPALPIPTAARARDRLPFVAALTLVGATLLTLAVLQLASGGPDLSRLVSAQSSSTTGEIPTVSATTSVVRGSTEAETPPTAPPAVTTVPQATTAATTRPATTTVGPAGFTPTRSWAWAPVPRAAYYDVVFTRSGTSVYRATPDEPRLTLPATVVFLPGSYRWVVRPGFGERSARNLGKPVVDSAFTVS